MPKIIGDRKINAENRTVNSEMSFKARWRFGYLSVVSEQILEQIISNAPHPTLQEHYSSKLRLKI